MSKCYWCGVGLSKEPVVCGERGSFLPDAAEALQSAGVHGACDWAPRCHAKCAALMRAKLSSLHAARNAAGSRGGTRSAGPPLPPSQPAVGGWSSGNALAELNSATAQFAVRPATSSLPVLPRVSLPRSAATASSSAMGTSLGGMPVVKDASAFRSDPMEVVMVDPVEEATSAPATSTLSPSAQRAVRQLRASRGGVQKAVRASYPRLGGAPVRTPPPSIAA